MLVKDRVKPLEGSRKGNWAESSLLSPNGATVARLTFAPLGLRGTKKRRHVPADSQGFHPWLVTFPPLGLPRTPPGLLATVPVFSDFPAAVKNPRSERPRAGRPARREQDRQLMRGQAPSSAVGDR